MRACEDGVASAQKHFDQIDGVYMKPRTKRLLNLVLIVAPILIILVIGFSDPDLGSAIEALSHLGLRWVLLSILAYLGFVGMDAASIHYFLRKQGYRLSFGYIYYVSVLGQYYSNITPGATGGQPMQIYYLHKQGIPTGIATSALVVRFISFQAMLSIIGTVLWIAYGPFVAENLEGAKWLLIVGYVYNTLMVTLLIAVVFCRPVIQWGIGLAVRIGAKLRLLKKPEESKARWLQAAQTFHDSVHLIVKKPLQVLVQLLFGGLQLMLLMSVIWFVYCGLGLKGATYGQLTTLSVMEYLSAAYAPMPGASGAQEGVFSLYFSHVFPDGVRFAALLLWRFFTYYFSLLVGGLVVLAVGLRSGKSLKEIRGEETQRIEQVIEPTDRH